MCCFLWHVNRTHNTAQYVWTAHNGESIFHSHHTTRHVAQLTSHPVNVIFFRFNLITLSLLEKR